MALVSVDDPTCYAHPVSVQKSLGARLKSLRLEQKISATKVATLLEKTPAHIFGIEAGQNSPSLRVLEALARLYNVDECDLFIYPGEGIKHDIREQLRAVPTVHTEKLEAILHIVERLVVADSQVSVDILQVLMSMEQPLRAPTEKKAPRRPLR